MPEFHGGGSLAREPVLGVTREGPTTGGPSQLLSSVTLDKPVSSSFSASVAL